jgi:hypothetical protein
MMMKIKVLRHRQIKCPSLTVTDLRRNLKLSTETMAATLVAGVATLKSASLFKYIYGTLVDTTDIVP